MIKRVKLKNWRSHRESVLEFSKGTNMLVGIMGSGKSSVLEAICFALYGTFPALARRKIRLNQLVSNASNEITAAVEVVIEKNGNEYTFIRTISNGKGDAELRENGKLIEIKSDSVTKMAEHILGVDYDLFTKAVYAEQNSLDYFLTLTPIDRKRQIDELIGIDRFELARENATKLANRMTKEIEEKKKALALYDKAKVFEERRAAEEKLAAARKEYETLARDLQSANRECEMLKVEYETLEQKKRVHNELSRKEIECKTFVEEMSKNIKGYKRDELELESKAVERLESEVKSLRKKVREVDLERSALAKELGEMKSIVRQTEEARSELALVNERMMQLKDAGDVKKIRMEIDSINREIWKVGAEHSSKKKECEMLENECMKIRDELKERVSLEKELAELKWITQRVLNEKKQLEENTRSWEASLHEVIKLSNEAIEKLSGESSGLCPLCGSQLDAKKKAILIATKKEIIEKSEDELRKCKQQLAQQRKEIDAIERGMLRKAEIERILSELEAKDRQLQHANTRLSGLRNECATLEKHLTELNNRLADLTAKVGEAEEAAAVKERAKEIEAFLEKNKDAKAKLESITKQHDAINAEVASYQELLTSMEKEFVSRANLTAEIEKDIELQARVLEKKQLMLKISDEMKEVNYSEDELKKAAEALNMANLRKKEIEVKLDNARSNIPILETNAELLSKQLAEIENSEEEIRRLQAATKNLSAFQQSVVETQVALRSELVNSINAVMEKIWGILYPYGDIEKVRLDATESDYVLMTYRRGEWVPVEGNVSGGERTSAVLALRVALSIVLAPSISMLMLDEPTHNLDENGVRSLSEILRERLPQVINQSFVITHDELLKEGASGRLYTFYRDKGANGPTQIVADTV